MTEVGRTLSAGPAAAEDLGPQLDASWLHVQPGRGTPFA